MCNQVSHFMLMRRRIFWPEELIRFFAQKILVA